MVFHVKVKNRKTTVTISDLLANLLAIKLVDKLAHEAVLDVVQWLQSKIDNDPQRYVNRVSQQLQEEALSFICPKHLYRKLLIRLTELEI